MRLSTDTAARMHDHPRHQGDGRSSSQRWCPSGRGVRVPFAWRGGQRLEKSRFRELHTQALPPRRRHRTDPPGVPRNTATHEFPLFSDLPILENVTPSSQSGFVETREPGKCLQVVLPDETTFVDHQYAIVYLGTANRMVIVNSQIPHGCTRCGCARFYFTARICGSLPPSASGSFAVSRGTAGCRGSPAAAREIVERKREGYGNKETRGERSVPCLNRFNALHVQDQRIENYRELRCLAILDSTLQNRSHSASSPCPLA